MKVVNTYLRSLPVRARVGEVNLLAVLTVDDCGFYKVYEGLVEIPENDHHRDTLGEWVARSGSACYYNRAITYFPHIPEEKYRG